MSERSLIFAAAEYRNRVLRLQVEMAAAGQDALLLTMPADIFYVTGFLTRFWESPARPWFVIVPATGDPVAVIPAIGSDLMQKTWITDIRTWAAPDPVDDGVTLLSDALKELTAKNSAIGLPMGLETHVRMPLADFDRVARQIAPRRIVDATNTLQRVREIKSDAEISKIRVACAIADRAFARVAQFARPGCPLDQIFRDFQITLLQEGADWVSYLAGGAGPGGYGDVISPANNRPLTSGDILMLDTGAVREGYFCDFDRNYAIGRADPDALRAHDALYGATQCALDQLRPGMTARDCHRLMTGHLAAQGAVPLEGRFGHGLGLTLTEWPSISAFDDTPLREGMVLTLEPGVQIAPGRIMVHEENIVLRDTGPELLSSRAPCDLPVIA